MRAPDFLVEIGTEELPPKALRSLMDAFAANLEATLADARLGHGDVHAYASPRRLSVIVERLEPVQPDRKISQKGPPLHIAFDDDGKPKPAALAFAKKCGVDIRELEQTRTDKGDYLGFEAFEAGRPLTELAGDIVEAALANLPVPRRMRWGAGNAEFVRPVHWIILLHGKSLIDATVMGIKAGNVSQGHRFHCEEPVSVSSPAVYLDALEKPGFVIADFERRRQLVKTGVNAVAKEAGGIIVDGDSLYDEVASLVEWPVPILGRFDERFLELPREVVISTLTGHQRYFPVAGKDGKLLARFVTVANLESREPDQVRDGNERVIRPRLADAAFFWNNDRQRSLDARQDSLRDVVYQRGLGSLYDKSSRVTAIATSLAEALSVSADNAARAAALCKCDLLTGMVGEFPELQGTMGRYYAAEHGEADAVATAIGEQYRPRFAGDAIPGSLDGRILSVADKLDTLAGVFAIGKAPTGNRDPFGLRRAALGVVRILVEGGMDLDLDAIIRRSAALQPAGKLAAEDIAADVSRFVSDRLRRYFLDRDPSLETETFDAVLARGPSSLVDFDDRLNAVQTFIALDEAQSLAAANKRIANIIKKANFDEVRGIKAKLLVEDAEIALHAALLAAADTVRPLLDERRYDEALGALARLRGPVDTFFDDVMVMADDNAIKENRLALLAELRALFLEIADISRLAIA